ncbi:hypothetical protein N0V93_000350 [Gnomoniopsis smithogilvyi]|uniref:Uncharacterized protein n=1 Tax=Gnomoniopsis smithogilvyi TaxID=1191159 RepID=A0A9W8Z3V2_9PEZI|nr:hypothetical protein N0V93_000350 [Gnomoniopsis smithogilvyi]
MPPHQDKPVTLARNVEDGFLTIRAFEGAIITRVLHDPNRSFSFEVTMKVQHPRLVNAPKPPMHFHHVQVEYLRCLEGVLCLDMNGTELVLRPDDGEITIHRDVHHRTYPHGGVSLGLEPTNTSQRDPVVRFLLSAEHSPQPFQLDLAFFENWYAYQEKVVLGGSRLDMIQVLSIFDAGGTYLSFPWWIPFRRSIARTLGIVLGRWVGGILGYQPFYREWTTDWEQACQKMETCVFQRRFSDRSKND